MPQPHDELFRTIVAHPEDAQGLIAELLPPLVRERIDWSTLEPAPGTFVMPELATRHVDALFTARIAGRPALLYLLLEHQSEPDPLMPLRMAGYMVRIYDDVLRKDPSAKRVPMIVPLVVHHGEGGWTAPRRFQEMLDAEPEILAALAQYLPEFELVIDDLAKVPDEELRQRQASDIAIMTLLLLKRGRSAPDIVAELERWAEHLRRVLQSPHYLAAYAAMMSYIREVTETPEARLQDFARQLGPRAEEALMTGAEILRREGRADGKAEGKAELLLRLLAKRFGALSAAAEQRIRAASMTELDRWTDLVLTAQSLDEFKL